MFLALKVMGRRRPLPIMASPLLVGIPVLTVIVEVMETWVMVPSVMVMVLMLDMVKVYQLLRVYSPYS